MSSIKSSFVKSSLPKDFFTAGFDSALNLLFAKVKLSDSTKAHMSEVVKRLSINKRVINEICCMIRKVFVFNNSQFLNVKEWENELRKRQLIRKDIFVRFLLRFFKKDIAISYVERLRMSLFMTKLARNGLSTRARNRDMVDAHPRSYFRKYGASRHTISELQRAGHIPGLIAASW